MNSQLLKSAILVVFGMTVLVVAFHRLRRYRLKERYALMLMLVGAPFLLLAIWQNAVGQLAEWLGIQYTTFSLLCVTAFLFMMIFELLTIVSVQEQKINTLSQMIGLLMQQGTAEANSSPAQQQDETRETADVHRK